LGRVRALVASLLMVPWLMDSGRAAVEAGRV
jgi:hypothetical protein